MKVRIMKNFFTAQPLGTMVIEGSKRIYRLVGYFTTKEEIGPDCPENKKSTLFLRNRVLVKGTYAFIKKERLL